MNVRCSECGAPVPGYLIGLCVRCAFLHSADAGEPTTDDVRESAYEPHGAEVRTERDA